MIRSRVRPLLPCLLVSTLGCSLAAAGVAGDEGGRLALDAFGTFGVVHSSESQADFSRSSLMPRGAGASADLAMDVDSLLGVQVRAELGPRLSATVQVVSELRYDRTFRPNVEWAYLSWDATPDFAIRLGRTSAPTFALTDTRRIGYAQHWVRPPNEVYDLVPVTNNDGIDVVWRTRAFGATHTWQAAYGRSEATLAPRGIAPVDSVSDQQLTLRYSIERGPFTGYLNFGRDRLSVEGFEELFGAFAQFGPQGEAIARRYGTLRKKGDFQGVGATWDPGRWFVMGEWARTHSPSVTGTRVGSYLTGGIRVGAWTPYLVVSEGHATSARSDPGLDLALVPAELVPAAAGLNAALNAMLEANGPWTTIAAGVRWDASRRLALKLQHEHIDIGARAWGPLTNVQPGFVPGGNVRVTSATLSFVL